MEDQFVWDIMLIGFVLIPTCLMMGFILLALHRWRLPFGTLSMIVTVNAILNYLVAYGFNKGQHSAVLVAAFVGGLMGDVLLRVFRPSRERLLALRLFSFEMPFILFLVYFVILLLTSGIWWSIHMWLGVCFMAGIVGLSLSFLFAPPMPQ